MKLMATFAILSVVAVSSLGLFEYAPMIRKVFTESLSSQVPEPEAEATIELLHSTTTNMSKLTSIALIGAGSIGSSIISALKNQSSPLELIVLSRDPKSIPGVNVVKVDDYDDASAVAAILTHYGIDVVVSTVGMAGVTAQFKMADAAKEAGVKLFVPSDYGTPDGAPFFKEKDRVAGEPPCMKCFELKLMMTACLFKL